MLVENQENSKNACQKENDNKFIKIWILMSRRNLKMDFSKLEMFSWKWIQKFNLKQ